MTSTEFIASLRLGAQCRAQPAASAFCALTHATRTLWYYQWKMG